MRRFSTIQQLSADLSADPRTVARELNKAGLQPDGELTRGKRPLVVYDRQKIAAALAADLLPMFKR
jgi:hypothetical protein